MNELIFLDQRKRLILNALLKDANYLTSDDLSIISGVTPRTVRNDLKKITDELKNMKLSIQASPGLGYRIPEDSKDQIRIRLNAGKTIPPVSPEERMVFIIRELIASPVKISNLLSRIHISESTWEKDLERTTSWFRSFGLVLSRKKNELELHGTEDHLRKVYIPYYYERSRLSGLSIETLLEEDFPQFRQSKSSLDSFIREIELKFTDEDYFGNLIYLLASLTRVKKSGAVDSSEGSSAQSHFAEVLFRHLRANEIEYSPLSLDLIVCRFEKTGILSRENNDLSMKIKNCTVSVLNQLNQIPDDDDLIEGLCLIIFSSINQDMLHSSTAISLQELEKQYPEALNLAVAFLKEMQKISLFREDDTLLVRIGMCFAAFLERIIFRSRKRVSVICSTGIGTSQLLAAKLKRTFPNIEILGIYPKHLLREAESMSPDFIISTVDLDTEYEVVKISSFLNYGDFDRIIPLFRKNKRGEMLFRSLLSEELFFTDIDQKTPHEVIRLLCRSAFGTKGKEFEERVLEREALGSTALGKLAAIPHALRGESAENRICVGILKKPIRWGKDNVQIVFLLRLDDPDIDMAAVFDYLYSLISDRQLIRSVIRDNDFLLLKEGRRKVERS
ncbi:MAG: PTS sugar transporter subunit IIA [Spirochaetales bacterium]|nr:PTS sugar transporter subunit IIA [Spirochaetales bacterium]